MYSVILTFFYILFNTISASLSSCLYTQSAELFNSYPSSSGNRAQGYVFSLTWNTTKCVANNYSFALNSYQIQTNKFLSYDADLLNLTTNGGIFYFNPSAISQIYRVSFTIILKLNCDQYFLVSLITYPLIPIGTILTYNHVIGLWITNTSDYVTTAFISSYEIQSITTHQELMAEAIALAVNVNYCSIKLFTNNALTQFKFTHIFYRASSGTFKPLFYSKVYASDTYGSVSSMDASSIFSAPGYSRCIFGISYKIQYSCSFYKSTSQFSESLSTITFTPTLSNIKILYSIFCQAICPLNSYPDYSISTIACSACPIIPNCTVCLDYSRCGSCNNNTQFLNDNFECSYCKDHILNCSLCASKYNCDFCDLGFYSDNTTNYTCSPCSKLDLNCISCNGSKDYSICLSCQDGFYLDFLKNYTCSFCLGACKTCLSRDYCLSCRSSSYSFVLNSTNTICVSCLPECQSCVSLETCTQCRRGQPAKGGCTQIITCLQVNISLPYTINRCIVCALPNQLQENGSCNGCVEGYFLAGEVCTNIPGCKTAAKIGINAICVVCYFEKNFILLPIQSVCHCKEGYHIVNNTCKQICGDGKRIIDKCDDGNQINGDGCSQNCEIQEGFYCDPKNAVISTKCIYIQTNVELILEQVIKISQQNKAQFTFRFKPYLSMDKFLNTKRDIKFSTMSNLLVEHTVVSADTLIMTLQYFEDIEGQPANVQVKLDPFYFLQTSVLLNFVMAKDGLLIYQQNISAVKTFSDLFFYLSILSLIILCISLWFHKMVGVQFIYPLQFIYLSQLINTHPTPQFSILNYFALLAFNFSQDPNHQSNFVIGNNLIQYNPQNEQFCVKMISPALLICSLLSVLGIFLASTKDYHKLVKILAFIYNRIFFTICVAILPTFYIIIMTKTRQIDVSKSVHLLESISSIILSLEYFYEWRRLVCLPQNDQIIQKLSCSVNYIPCYLSLLTFNFITLIMNYKGIMFQFQIYILAFSGFFFIMVIIVRPYSSNVHNIGLLFNLFPLIYYLGWCILRDNIQGFRKEEKQMNAILFLIGLVVLSMLITLIRLIYQFKNNYKNTGKKRQQNKFQPETNMKPFAQTKDEELESKKIIYGQNLYMDYFNSKKKQNELQVPSHFFQNISKKVISRQNQRDLKKQLLQKIKKGKKKITESSIST